MYSIYLIYFMKTHWTSLSCHRMRTGSSSSDGQCCRVAARKHTATQPHTELIFSLSPLNMFSHHIPPPVGSGDGLKINPLLITEPQKKNQGWVLQFWQHLEQFFSFQECNANMMNRLDKKQTNKQKNANLSSALFQPKSKKMETFYPVNSKTSLLNCKDKQEHHFLAELHCPW